MFRKAFCLGLVGLTLCAVPVRADTGSPATATRTTANSSSSKRVIWTLVGIGAGFGAGLFIGLHAFDDAINSDRKVWTSAIVGAAAGGVAAGLLSRNVGRAPQVQSPEIVPKVAAPLGLWTSVAVLESAGDESLRRRVREVNSRRSGAR
jgi:hypothetical protein